MTYDVIIAGAGPVGLMLAGELSLAGLRPLVLDRLTEPDTEPKANGLVGQVVSMMDRRGLYEALSGTAGPPQPNSAYFMFAALPVDLSLIEHSPVYTLPVPQLRIVQVLRDRALELGAEMRWGTDLVGFTQDEDGVSVDISDSAGTRQLRARYLVGADGAHSLVRKMTGIDFPGISYDRTTGRTVNATVPADWVDPATGALQVPGFGVIRPFLPIRTEHGGFAYAPFPGRMPLLNTNEWDSPVPEDPMSLTEMRASIERVLGVDIPLGPPTGEGPHLMRRVIGGNTRMAERFRERRVLLAGDAAHVLVFGGGPGLNLGLQDAMNLGWKLAAELRGDAPADLLDTYDTERRAAARRSVVSAQAQGALQAPGADVTALREIFGELLTDRSTVQRVADLIAGADVRYDMGEPDPHPLVGWSAPDMDLRTDRGTVRLAELTRTAKPLLLDLTERRTLAESLPEWSDRIDIVTARTSDRLAGAVLLRPDSYVAWASDAQRMGEEELGELRNALARWFGATVARTP